MTSFRLDGSNTLAAAGNEVWVTEKASQSTRYNALWQDGPGLVPAADVSVAQCFRVEALEGENVWVGLTDEAHFGAGWKCKGLDYGGNLSDGGGLKRSRFGPGLDAGSSVDIRAELAPEAGGDTFTLNMHLAQDGKGLGQAFNVGGLKTAMLGAIFPLIAFSSGPAKARISRVEPCPPAEAFALPAAAPRTSMAGEWVAAPSAFVSDTPPADYISEVVFHVGDKPWSIGARVANSMSVQLSDAEPHAAEGGVRATMMMPPPEMQPLEKAVGEVLGSISGLKLKPDGGEGELLVTHAHGTLALRPHSTVHKPVTREEVGWLDK